MEQIGHPQLLQQIGAVIAGAAVHRKAHGNAQFQHFRHPAHAGAELHVGDGTVGNAGTGLRQTVQLLPVKMDAVGVPDVRADPAEGFHVFQGPHPAPLLDEALLVLRLAEVGMEPHAQISGQKRGLPQQLLGNAEG